MAKVIDLQGVARGEAHRGNVRCLNPDVYWTEQDVEDVMSDEQNHVDQCARSPETPGTI
jgi:hypothetical protein